MVLAHGYTVGDKVTLEFQSSLDVSLGTRLILNIPSAYGGEFQSSLDVSLGTRSGAGSFDPAVVAPFQSSLDVSLGTRRAGVQRVGVISVGFNRPWTSLLVLAARRQVETIEAVQVSIVLGRLSWYSQEKESTMSDHLTCFNRPWTSLLVLAQVVFVGRYPPKKFQSSLDVSLGTRR